MKHKIQEVPKLNLIPILDAIFIFIFFLLMSAQFLDIFEIGTDAPISMSTDEVKSKKEPLNLILDISKNKIIVKTGLDENVVKTFEERDLSKLNKYLIDLKRKNLSESAVILRPDSKYKYQKIIKIIDTVKAIKKKGQYIEVTKNGKKKLSQVLFDQVIFNTGG